MLRWPNVALAAAVRWKKSRLFTLKVVRTKAYACNSSPHTVSQNNNTSK